MIAVALRSTQIDQPLLMIFCLLYVILAIPWLWFQGMGDPTAGRDLLRDRIILVGLFLVSGTFLALLVTGVRNVPT